MHIITQTMKTFLQAGIVYGFLIFGYSQVADSAECGNFSTLWTSLTQNGSNTIASSMFRRQSSGSDPSDCGAMMLTGDEYENLIKNRIDTANVNISTLQTNQLTLQNNLQTVNTGLQSVADIAAANKAKIEELETYLQTHALRDETNLLHITHDDALTLFYAVMGLFAVAFVWRFARNSLNVSDVYTAAE